METYGRYTEEVLSSYVQKYTNKGSSCKKTLALYDRIFKVPVKIAIFNYFDRSKRELAYYIYIYFHVVIIISCLNTIEIAVLPKQCKIYSVHSLKFI
jgi:hypothetical protein